MLLKINKSDIEDSIFFFFFFLNEKNFENLQCMFKTSSLKPMDTKKKRYVLNKVNVH